LSGEEQTVENAKDPFEGIDFAQHREIYSRRQGPRPTTEGPVPQRQVDQHGDADMWDELYRRCFALPGVIERGSLVVDGGAAPAMCLGDGAPTGPKDAFIAEREFGHIHAKPDSSLHLQLPVDVGILAISGGWAELHSIVWLGVARPEAVMVYAPRDEKELEVVWNLILESYRYARGEEPILRYVPLPAPAQANPTRFA
jgi:hypothetical protein